jgi:hypothetical protein
MNSWFLSKVRYTKQLENGTFKRVSEPYLLAAMSFTDTESRIYEELGEVIRGEFIVVSIAREELHDIFNYSDADVWWKCKISFDGSMEDSDKQKKVNQTFLVGANSAKEATERLQESLSTMLVDFEITSVVKSPIVEIFPYNEELDKEISRRPLEETEDALLTDPQN